MGMVCPSCLSFILYNPFRKALTDRKKVLDESGITGDSIVLEIGAGNGFFTEALAERAKKVYAVELQDGMVRKLKKRIQRFGDAVSIIHGDISSQSIGDNFTDVCFLYYSFHEVENKIDAAKNIGGAIKTSGVLAIYEPTIEVGRAAMQRTVQIFQDHGFNKEHERNDFFTRFVKMRKRREG
jgi:tRNA A58 N-methylase Trm61